MIVVAIIGILAAIAIPAYQNYTARAKITEMLSVASSAKTSLSEGFQSGGITGLNAAATDIRAQTANTSKYVGALTAANNTGVITITSSSDASLPSDARNATILLTPYLGTALLTAATTPTDAPLQWACSSAGRVTALARVAGIRAGTMPAKYVPSECK